MKRLSLIGIIFLLLSNLNAFDLPWESDKRKASIKEVINGTVEVKENIKEISLEFIIENIQNANKLVSDLKEDVNSEGFFTGKKSDDEKFEIIIEGTKELKDFYVELDSQNPEIKEKILNYKKDIVQYSISLQEKLRNEKSNLKNLKFDLKVAPNNYKNDKLDIVTKSLEQRIKFSQKRVDMMNSFIKNYNKIEKILTKVDVNVDKFIFTIENTKLVYISAYKTLKLGKDIKTAYQNLEDLKSLEQLSDDMISSWKNLDTIVEKLTKQMAVFED